MDPHQVPTPGAHVWLWAKGNRLHPGKGGKQVNARTQVGKRWGETGGREARKKEAGGMAHASLVRDSTSPVRAGIQEVFMKHKDQGLVTKWLWGNWKKGDQ